MTSDHLGPISRNTEIANLLLGPGYGFGLGFAVRLAAGESPMAGSAGDYWWGGGFRTVLVIDPLRELVAVLMVKRTKLPVPAMGPAVPHSRVPIDRPVNGGLEGIFTHTPRRQPPAGERRLQPFAEAYNTRQARHLSSRTLS